MTVRRVPARAILAAILALALLAAAALAWAGRDDKLAQRPAGERPQLMLLTSLPLVFGEEFGLASGGSPTLEALETRYRVEPIGVADARSLGRGRLLLMAHPRAQPGEALVDLDRWVRSGGKVLILADPKLDRPSAFPLGHRHRPPLYFADTGLLRHWGLRLDAPERAGQQERVVDGRRVHLSSPGTLQGKCRTRGEGLVARCRIGAGKATIVADADLVQPPGATPGQVDSNLQFLLGELARLER